jgi:hypothetical protein
VKYHHIPVDQLSIHKESRHGPQGFAVGHVLPNGGNRMSISALGQGDFSPVSSTSSGEVAQYRKTSLSSTQTAGIEITTAEGDKVTLSVTAQVDASIESHASYEHLRRSRGGHHGHHRAEDTQPQDAPANRSSVSLTSTQQYSLSVEGNLNQQELQDIHKALQALGQAASKIQSGNLEGAQAKLEKLGDLTSLSSLSATVSMQQSVTTQASAGIRSNAG